MSLAPLPEEYRGPVIFKPVTATAAVAGSARRSRWRAWAGLLWCEWFAHSRLVLLTLASWLVAVWAMPLVAHPDWILLFGLIYAILAGPAYGGGDVVEGCEEFSFALPATRTERYLARLAVGGGALLLLTGINLLVLGLDLPQALSRLYYDAGLVKRQHPHNPASLYALVFAFPFTVFSGGFACAAVTRSRALVVTAWLWGGLASLSLLFLGGRYEELLWGHFRGTVTCPLLIIAGLVMLVGGWQGYRKKEVGPNAPRLQLPDRWWLWALAFLVGLALATALLTAVLKAWPGLQGLN